MPETPSNSRVQPVILAGGESRRFVDGDKAFATLGGIPLLERVLATVSKVTETNPVVAVRDQRQRQQIEEELLDERPVTTRFILDDSDFQGPLAGLYAACSNLDATWLFLVGCDMPFVDAKAVSWLFDRPQISTADAIVPETDHGIEPLHALYRRDSVKAVRKRVRTDDGLYVLFDVLDETRVVPVRDCPYNMNKSTRNVNTVEDLNTLEERRDDDSQ